MNSLEFCQMCFAKDNQVIGSFDCKHCLLPFCIQCAKKHHDFLMDYIAQLSRNYESTKNVLVQQKELLKNEVNDVLRKITQSTYPTTKVSQSKGALISLVVEKFTKSQENMSKIDDILNDLKDDVVFMQKQQVFDSNRVKRVSDQLKSVQKRIDQCLFDTRQRLNEIQSKIPTSTFSSDTASNQIQTSKNQQPVEQTTFKLPRRTTCFSRRLNRIDSVPSESTKSTVSSSTTIKKDTSTTTVDKKNQPDLSKVQSTVKSSNSVSKSFDVVNKERAQTDWLISTESDSENESSEKSSQTTTSNNNENSKNPTSVIKVLPNSAVPSTTTNAIDSKAAKRLRRQKRLQNKRLAEEYTRLNIKLEQDISSNEENISVAKAMINRMATDGQFIVYTCSIDSENREEYICSHPISEKTKAGRFISLCPTPGVVDIIWWSKIGHFICATKAGVHKIRRKDTKFLIDFVIKLKNISLSIASNSQNLFLYERQNGTNRSEQRASLLIYSDQFQLLRQTDLVTMVRPSSILSMCVDDQVLAFVTMKDDDTTKISVHFFDLINNQRIASTNLDSWDKFTQIRADDKKNFYVTTGTNRIHRLTLQSTSEITQETVIMKNPGDCLAVINDKCVAVSARWTNVRLVCF